MDKEQIEKIRDDILMRALEHAVFDGWNWAMAERASSDAGHSADSARAVFPAGVSDVLDHFSDWADRQMLAALTDIDSGTLRVRDRVRTALMARYRVLEPHKDAVRLSAQYWMVPTRKPHAARLVWRTADKIWDWAGDTATDYNRYTKRGLLSGVIVSTSLAWMNDQSAALDNTASFLDRRIENVMQLGKVIGKFRPQSKVS